MKDEKTPHYAGPPFTRADFEEAKRLKAEPLATPVVCFDDDIRPLCMYDSGELMRRAQLLQADMIQHVAEDDADKSAIEAAFAELYKFLGGER